MKPATKLGIGLGVLVVLYFVALALGVGLNDPASSRTPAWAKSLGRVSEWFTPKLPLGRLRCNDQPVASAFHLTEAQSQCTVSIPRDGREDYRKADLRVLEPADLNTYVYAKVNDGDLPDDEHKRCIPNVEGLAAFRLVVTYEPDDGSDGDSCWLLQERGEPVALTVLEDGGDLTLECIGCDNGREVRLRME